MSAEEGLVCLDVRAYRARDSISRRAKCAPVRVVTANGRVGVPGCEGPSARSTHFQAEGKGRAHLDVRERRRHVELCEKRDAFRRF